MHFGIYRNVLVVTAVSKSLMVLIIDLSCTKTYGHQHTAMPLFTGTVIMIDRTA